jgi:hypothetical protein
MSMAVSELVCAASLEAVSFEEVSFAPAALEFLTLSAAGIGSPAWLGWLIWLLLS